MLVKRIRYSLVEYYPSPLKYSRLSTTEKILLWQQCERIHISQSRFDGSFRHPSMPVENERQQNSKMNKKRKTIRKRCHLSRFQPGRTYTVAFNQKGGHKNHRRRPCRSWAVIGYVSVRGQIGRLLFVQMNPGDDQSRFCCAGQRWRWTGLAKESLHGSNRLWSLWVTGQVTTIGKTE